MMVRIAWIACLAVSVAAVAAGRQAAYGSQKSGAAPQSSLEAFKKLAGDWVGKGTAGAGGGEETRVNFKVTAGGSTVVETELPGTNYEMLTLIHPDGDDLILTHYCHLGNQPQMRAPGKMDGNRVAFKFVRVTNANAEKDAHMHQVTYTFVDDNTLKSEWTLYQGNKPAGSVTFELKRKK